MNISLYCYAGLTPTACFDELAEIVYQSKWFVYEIQMRNNNFHWQLSAIIFKMLMLIDFLVDEWDKSKKKNINYL